MKQKGIIFDIQRWSLHDGPGIRTNVFLKGCPLSCSWCSNPESQYGNLELAFFQDKCISCGSCQTNCPHGAITLQEDGVQIDYHICRTTCYQNMQNQSPFGCTQTCYARALEIMGQSCTAEEVIEEVMKDEEIYKTSGGGLTVTGGEPLFQPDFLLELLTCAKGKNLHTAMETCMYGSWDVIKTCLPYIDFLFMDLKLLDDEKHRKYTGVSNRIILENIKRTAEYAQEHALDIVIRTPVIPGINDRPEDIRAMASWIKDNLPGVERYQLLPYHRLGRGKYHNIGKTYDLSEVQPPSKSTMEQLEQEIRKLGLRRN